MFFIATFRAALYSRDVTAAPRDSVLPPPKNFAVIGVAGYIAPRHLAAIRDTGNRIRAVTDPSDSVGLLDQFSKDIAYFREFERFDRHVDKLRRRHKADAIDYVSICSPNYLHDSHIRFALRVGAHAICEKPLVLRPWNGDGLLELENETGRRVYTILQLRLHPAVLAFKAKLDNSRVPKRRKVTLRYITARGPWYQYSWKGDVERSGGLVTNIGIHLFDLLLWLFGPVESLVVSRNDSAVASGTLTMRDADVDWLLSIDERELPSDVRARGESSYRSLDVDGESVEFSTGFADLHTAAYRDILAGRGFGIADAMPSIKLVHDIRQRLPETRSHMEAHHG